MGLQRRQQRIVLLVQYSVPYAPSTWDWNNILGADYNVIVIGAETPTAINQED